MVAYLDRKYKQKEDDARLKYNASYLTIQLEAFQRERTAEMAYYNLVLTKLVDRFLKRREGAREEVTVSIILFDADINRSDDQMKLLDFACAAFVEMFRSKGYPPIRISEPEERYSDACEGSCLRKTRLFEIPLLL